MNPQPYTTVPVPSPPKDKCTADCDHGFHGMPCRIAGCTCASSVPHLVALEQEEAS